MLRLSKVFLLIAVMILMIAGCSNPDGVSPSLPSDDGPVGGGNQGDAPESPIPTPWVDQATGVNLYASFICDMEWELDGDLVVSTADQGMLLWTPYGVLKRQYQDVGCVAGLANNDTGLGMSFYGASAPCNPDGIDDDLYVSDVHGTTHFDDQWWAGNPDPTPEMCDLTITCGWGCTEESGRPPSGYAYHPITGRTYIKVNTGGVWIGDGECAWDEDIGNVVSPEELCGSAMGDVILSYDQRAPFPPDIWFTGPPDEPNDIAGDWVLYNTGCPVDNCIQALAGYGPGYQRMANTSRKFSFNGTDPPG